VTQLAPHPDSVCRYGVGRAPGDRAALVAAVARLVVQLSGGEPEGKGCVEAAREVQKP
jgi:hypothetical protein